MCGIVAMVQLDGTPVDLPLLGHMAAALDHRGPDDEGRQQQDHGEGGGRAHAFSVKAVRPPRTESGLSWPVEWPARALLPTKAPLDRQPPPA